MYQSHLLENGPHTCILMMAPDLDSILRDFKYRRPGRAFSFLLLIVLIWIHHHHHHWVPGIHVVFATSCSEALVREKPRKYLHVHVALTSMLNQSRPHVDDISTKRSVLGSVAAGFQMIDVFFFFSFVRFISAQCTPRYLPRSLSTPRPHRIPANRLSANENSEVRPRL